MVRHPLFLENTPLSSIAPISDPAVNFQLVWLASMVGACCVTGHVLELHQEVCSLNLFAIELEEPLPNVFGDDGVIVNCVNECLVVGSESLIVVANRACLNSTVLGCVVVIEELEKAWSMHRHHSDKDFLVFYREHSSDPHFRKM